MFFRKTSFRSLCDAYVPAKVIIVCIKKLLETAHWRVGNSEFLIIFYGSVENEFYYRFQTPAFLVTEDFISFTIVSLFLVTEKYNPFETNFFIIATISVLQFLSRKFRILSIDTKTVDEHFYFSKESSS